MNNDTNIQSDAGKARALIEQLREKASAERALRPIYHGGMTHFTSSEIETITKVAEQYPYTSTRVPLVMRTQLLGRFEVIAGKLGLKVPAELRPSLLRILVKELEHNLSVVSRKTSLLVSATIYEGNFNTRSSSRNRMIPGETEMLPHSARSNGNAARLAETLKRHIIAEKEAAFSDYVLTHPAEGVVEKIHAQQEQWRVAIRKKLEECEPQEQTSVALRNPLVTHVERQNGRLPLTDSIGKI